MKPFRVLFVCMANIVRSPAAENLFTHEVQLRGLDGRFAADSAGTTPGFAGQPPHPIMSETAARYGVTNSGISRTITTSDLQDFDLILAMDSMNYEDLMALAENEAQKEKIHYLREYHPEPGDTLEIGDPIMGTSADFIEAYSIIQASVQGLIEYLLEHSS